MCIVYWDRRAKTWAYRRGSYVKAVPMFGPWRDAGDEFAHVIAEVERQNPGSQVFLGDKGG